MITLLELLNKDLIAVITTIFISSVIIDITPIKLNPIKYLLNAIGKSMNKDLTNEIKILKCDVEQLNKNFNETRIKEIRWEILSFANSCRRGYQHGKDEFFHIFEINKEYHSLIKKLNVRNGVIDIEYDYIEKMFEKAAAAGKFSVK